MNLIMNNVLLFAILAYLILLVFDLVKLKKKKVTLLQILIVSIVSIVLYLLTGFPFPKVSFGGSSSTTTVFIMFGFVVFGIVSNYLFFVKAFEWREFLRPILISPIVLMPLYGLLEGANDIQDMKMISLCLASYQNGFFWKVLFEKISKSVGEES